MFAGYTVGEINCKCRLCRIKRAGGYNDPFLHTVLRQVGHFRNTDPVGSGFVNGGGQRTREHFHPVVACKIGIVGRVMNQCIV